MRNELDIRKRLAKAENKLKTDMFYAATDGDHGHINQIFVKEVEILKWVLDDKNNVEKMKELKQKQESIKNDNI